MRGAAAAADGTGQDRGGVATSVKEPERPRAPQSRGPGPVIDGPRKGERRRRRRRRGGSGDTMSSPSPGKRRMDTDVVKLYPSWRGDSSCRWVGGCVRMPRAPLKPKQGHWGTPGHCSRLPSSPPSPQCLRRLLGTSQEPRAFSAPPLSAAPRNVRCVSLFCTPFARVSPPQGFDSQDGLFFAGPATSLPPCPPQGLSCLLALDLGTRDRNSRE